MYLRVWVCVCVCVCLCVCVSISRCEFVCLCLCGCCWNWVFPCLSVFFYIRLWWGSYRGVLVTQLRLRAITPLRRKFRPFMPSQIIIISGTEHTITPNLRTSGLCFRARYPYISIYRTWDPSAVKMGFLYSYFFLNHAITPIFHRNHSLTPYLSITPSRPIFFVLIKASCTQRNVRFVSPFLFFSLSSKRSARSIALLGVLRT